MFWALLLRAVAMALGRLIARFGGGGSEVVLPLLDPADLAATAVLLLGVGRAGSRRAVAAFAAAMALRAAAFAVDLARPSWDAGEGWLWAGAAIGALEFAAEAAGFALILVAPARSRGARAGLIALVVARALAELW